MIVHVVVERQIEADVNRGVFVDRRAAREFVKLQRNIDRFMDDFTIEKWQVENLVEVRAKFKKREKRRMPRSIQRNPPRRHASSEESAARTPLKE